MVFRGKGKMNEKVTIRRLRTGIPGMDDLLGGGLPEFSFNLIVGAPGSGKTTLAHQLMFSLANPDSRALYFTVLGEPTLKILRYQQQFAFFDIGKVDESIRFINLSVDLLEGDFERVLTRINEEVRDFNPSVAFVDSFQSVIQGANPEAQGLAAQQRFVQQLGLQMTNWQATTFLIGEFLSPALKSNPVFSVADGILWLTQNMHDNVMMRNMQVVKMRGQAQSPGLHSFRIGSKGIQVFTHAIVKQAATDALPNKGSVSEVRLTMGIPGLDAMLGGGLPSGYSLLVVGPSGSGKTILATEFLAEGAYRGELGIIAMFEKSPSQLINGKLNTLVKAGQVGWFDLDLSIDQTFHDLIEMTERMQAKRVVIDSLSEFELALAPEFCESFRSLLYRMVAELTGKGVTVLMTSQLEDRYTDLRFSPFGYSFLTDAIIVQRPIEIEGQSKRVLSVVKVRGSWHSKDTRLFDIYKEGIVIGETLPGYTGILSGRPTASSKLKQPND
jgi:circadian clock protein KaiC